MSVMSQEEYIAILFNDLEFDGKQRRAWLQEEFGVNYPDELTTRDKSALIDRLKSMKEELE